MPLAIAWLLLSLATAANQGFYSPSALAYLVLAALLLVVPRSFFGDSGGSGHSAILLVVLLASSYNLLVTLVAHEGTRYHADWTKPWIALAQVIFIAGIVSYSVPVARLLPRSLDRLRFPALVLVSYAIFALAVAGSRAKFDVFRFLDEGVRGFLRGQNPYALTFTPPGYAPGSTFYNFDVYSYLPGTLLLTIPGAIFPDVRWVMLILTGVSAVLLRSLCRRLGTSPGTGDLVSLAFLAYPGLLFVLQEGYSEPLTVLLWIGALTAQLSAASGTAAVLAGLMLSVKQVNPPLLVSLLVGGMSRRGLGVALLVFGLITLPFLLRSPADFLWDTLIFQMLAPMPGRALSINGYLASIESPLLPAWVSYGVPLAVVAGAWLGLRGRADLASVLRLTAAFYLVLFLFNKFSYANYYVLVQAIVLVAFAAHESRDVLKRQPES